MKRELMRKGNSVRETKNVITEWKSTINPLARLKAQNWRWKIFNQERSRLRNLIKNAEKKIKKLKRQEEG